MIQNIMIVKLGSEADNPQRTIFSSDTMWEIGGENLIAYKNGILLIKPNDYTVIDRNHILLSIAAAPVDQISMIITKFKSEELDMVTLDRVAKKLESKTQTSINKNIWEESIPSNLIIHTDDVWATDIPTNPVEAISLGVAYFYDHITLTLDASVEYDKGWFASTNGLLSGRIINWIPPRFDNQYTIRLYDANNIEIPSSDECGWKWDYSSGYLFIENEHLFTTPFKISGYHYIGEYGGVPGGGAANWKTPVPAKNGLPTYGNLDGDVRLVLNENIFYRWENSSSTWKATAFSSVHYKDPVLTFIDLPIIENEDGDFRLVLSTNSIYRWDNTEWVPVLNQHEHDDLYYQKSYIDTQLNGKAPFYHDHHTIYYNKSEVNEMIRWRPPVVDEAHLPPYTENRDGDVIMTLDTKTIWRFDYFGFNQGEWIPVFNTKIYWLEPVQNFSDLPLTENFIGDVRMVLSESKPYFWNGSIWTESTPSRWKYPVANKTLLPISNNSIGDVRITLDNNNIYQWSGVEWILISASPQWRESVETLLDLPLIDNNNGDVRIVQQVKSIYQWTGTIWEAIVNSEHNHDGLNSAQIEAQNILNLYWKNPVVNFSELPLINNQIGDARIVLNDAKIYYWDGTEWSVISGESGGGIPVHNHDDRYYTESEINDIIEALTLSITNELALKASLDHIHDDRYYRKIEIDNRFNTTTGHDHDGIDSKKISYYDLKDTPSLEMHDHDDLYYRKLELQTAGESEVNWENITNKPNLTNGHWKSPVQTVSDLPATGNDLYDLRLVLDDSDIYEWDGIQWVYVGHWENQYVAYWREPIDTFQDLPLVGNVNGDVRLVLDDNMIYRWDSTASSWVVVSTTNSNIQVYLNGLLQMINVDYVRIREKAIQMTVPTSGGSKLTFIITGDSYMRKDWVCYPGQQVFEIINGYHRQDWLAISGQVDFDLTKSYTIGGNQLLVWLNGLLKKPGIDYLENSPTSFQFLTIPNDQDHVTAIIMEQESGAGEYIYEDQIAIQNQTVFILSNQYIVGSNQLLVYYNGNLQRLNDDYDELTSSSIELNTPLNVGERMTFIIFSNAIGLGGCCNAADVILGIPTDGDYDDGLITLYEETKVNDAIDWINETLVDMAPVPPDSLANKNFEFNGLNLYAGYVSNGNIHYESGPGSYHTYLTENNSFTLTTPSNSFKDADKGILKLYVNGTEVDSFRLYAAFVETNQDSNQSAISYGIQSEGARENEGLPGTLGAIRNSTNGYISIMSVGKYNNFKKWQKGQVRLNFSVQLLRQGYNTIYLKHDLTEVYFNTNILKIFYDNAGSRPYFDGDIYLTEDQLNSSKYVSGVRYYSIGDRFHAVFSVIRIFNNTFSQIPVKFDMPGLLESDISYEYVDVSGPQDPPAIGDFFNFNGYFILNQYNEYDINSKLTVQTFDPFGIGEIGITDSENRLVNTWTNGSTDLIEYFRDEIFRLPEGEYDTIPSIRTNLWNSQDLLVNGQALLFNNKLKYPSINFLGYKPIQAANYLFSGSQTYYRSFYKHSAKNSGTFIIDGISLSDLQSNNILIDIKLPEQTGWLSLNRNYDVYSFSGTDEDGCLLLAEGNNFTYSSGTFSTAYSGYMIIMRITLPNNTSPEISYMELLW